MIICLVGVLVAEDAEDGALLGAVFLFMLGAFPVSIGVAVLRYRLYEIDRLINRTLVYGVLTVLLAAAYAATTLVLGATLGSGSAWTTAGATLAVAAAFRPLRARVQDAVDRRSAAPATTPCAARRASSRTCAPGRRRRRAIEQLLRDVLSDPDARAALLASGERALRGLAGGPAAEPGNARRCPSPAPGVPSALVIHGPVDPERPRPLEEVVEAAGLAIEIARLNAELRRQLEEVEASRADRDRRLRGAPPDRARPPRRRPAAARVDRTRAAPRPARARPVRERRAGRSTRAVREIALAIDELRELARGVRPAQLDGGLAPALRELAGRAPLPVDVSAGGERFPHDVEAAAYFIASEGLTNAVKHSGASTVVVAPSGTTGAWS